MESADTATAVNNIGCCLYCLNRRGDARVKFERVWNIFSKALGPRHPRTVVAWRNLDRARRSTSSLRRNSVLESIHLRQDSDKLIIGGNFQIQALVPRPSTATKTKKKKSSGKGKKK